VRRRLNIVNFSRNNYRVSTLVLGSVYVNLGFIIIIIIFYLFILFNVILDEYCLENDYPRTPTEWRARFPTENVHSMTIRGVSSMKSMYPLAWKPKYFLFSAVLHVCSLDMVLGKLLLYCIHWSTDCIIRIRYNEFYV